MRDPPRPPPATRTRPYRPFLPRPRPAPLHQSSRPGRTCCGPSEPSGAAPAGDARGAPSRGPSTPASAPSTRPARLPDPVGVRASPPRLRARVPNKLAPSTRGPAPCKPPHGGPRGPAETQALRPPHLLGAWPLQRGTRPAASAGHSPDDRVPRRGCRAAWTAAAPGPGVPLPLLPERALVAGATSAATAAAGATRRARGRRRAAELAEEERQARAHGAGVAARRQRDGRSDGRGCSRHAEMRLPSTEERRWQVPPETAGREGAGGVGTDGPDGNWPVAGRTCLFLLCRSRIP